MLGSGGRTGLGGGGEAGTREAGLSIRKALKRQSPAFSEKEAPDKGRQEHAGGHAVHFCMCLPGTS